MGTQYIDVIPGQSAKSQACFPDFIPQKPAAPLCFLKLSIFAAHHKAGLLSELTHKNQPVQYASSILNLQVVLTHPQALNRGDEWRSRPGGAVSLGTRLDSQPLLQGRQTPLLQSRLQKTKVEKPVRTALLPDISTGVFCAKPSQWTKVAKASPLWVIHGAKDGTRTGQHIKGRCKAWCQRGALCED